MPAPPLGANTVTTLPSTCCEALPGAVPERPAASEFAFLIVKTTLSVSCGSRTTSKMPAWSASDRMWCAEAEVTSTIGAAVTARIASISAVGT